MEHKRYYIYCDESIKKGEYYSNFYGGAMINSDDYNLIKEVLERKRDNILKTSELKWQKINHHNHKAYIDAVDTLFDFIQSDKIKIRIMFTNNRFINNSLTKEQIDNEYFLLYYQFLKHAFGFRFFSSKFTHNLEVFLDSIPDKKEKRESFIEHLLKLQKLRIFNDSNIKIRRQQISEVDSKQHIIMQFLDVVLGAIAFKLNKRNTLKNPSTNKRGKRTIAKDKVYKHISKRIRQIYPNFNIGITTGKKGEFENILHMPYRHWVFKGKDSFINE